MTRVYNFGAGPATLPEDILSAAREELLDWQNTGMSVMEVSHRSTAFEQLIGEAEQDLRQLLTISEHYHVFFVTAPARAQFAMIPMNLLAKDEIADYAITGIWSLMASEEAKKFAQVNITMTEQTNGYKTIADTKHWQPHPQAKYVYYTSNETVNGVEFQQPPIGLNAPLVVDMTSSILSREIDVNEYGLIFAGTQKNIAPAGLTLVIVRDDLLRDVQELRSDIPITYDYQCFKKNKSLYYTPAAFSIYMAAKMFKWLLARGGVSAMETINQTKAAILYQAIDNSDFYHNPIDPAYRSRMNVPFTLADASLDTAFLKQADKAGLAALKGHRLVGGMRASIYNAMPQAGVTALVDFMRDFEQHHG